MCACFKGHYTSDVYNSEKRIWVGYDDNSKIHTDEDTMFATRCDTAYILFYEHS